MAKRGRICPLYDQQATNQQKANGCACQAPICGPASDCMGSLTRGCTVPAFVWRKPPRPSVARWYEFKDLFSIAAREAGIYPGAEGFDLR